MLVCLNFLPLKNFSKELFEFFFFLVCVCTCVYEGRCLQRAEVSDLPGAGAVVSCEPLYGCCELKLGPL